LSRSHGYTNIGLRNRIGAAALAIVTLFSGAVAAFEVGFAQSASAVTGSALINGDTVTGSTSVE
jgi:hypothetical protein